MTLFLGGYLVMVMGVAVWSRWLAGRVMQLNFRRLFRRFNQALGIMRWLIPAYEWA